MSRELNLTVDFYQVAAKDQSNFQIIFVLYKNNKCVLFFQKISSRTRIKTLSLFVNSDVPVSFG